MVDRPAVSRKLGYLRIDGEGGISVRDMREILAALEDSYEAIASIELLIAERISRMQALYRWSRRWGPPEMFMPLAGAFLPPQISDVQRPAAAEVPLVVSRVVLQSPGFWELMGTLNPLEVTRRYLNDRHERRKDDAYRSRAEADRLALDNAVRELDVLERYLQLRREYGEDLPLGPDTLPQIVASSVRPALERLAEFDDRGLISGSTATTENAPQEGGEASPGARPESD
jgi:hypothetical protein